MKIGIISGTGFYTISEGLQEELEIITKFGTVIVSIIPLGDTTLYHINRHGTSHTILSHLVNHQANIAALNKLGVDCIVATSVTGIVQPDIELGRLILFDDLYFPDNRLPNGASCTMFTEIGAKDRGHLILTSPFSPSLRNLILKTIKKLGYLCYDQAVYGYVNGPRFNTKTEIKALSLLQVSAISQTAGPESILAAELEIPYQLIGFGIDYANGVNPLPTPINILNTNIANSTEQFKKIILQLAQDFTRVNFDQGFVYKFE